MATAASENSRALAKRWYEKFSRHAEDLYPGRYTREKCRELADMGLEIKEVAAKKRSTIVVHNYLYPEFHEIADKVGDSLGLSLHVRDIGAERVDFESVFFMGATAKIITGDATQVFVPDTPATLGCTLVFGTDYGWLENWKKTNPDGLLVTYINSDAYTKSISDFISTSRNTHKIIAYAAKNFPGRKILVLPDKFLGYVMKAKAVEAGVDPNLVEVYSHRVGEWHAACYVHEKIGEHAIEEAMDEHPEAELMLHPECGCASSCLFKLHAGLIPHSKAYFLSTEQMVEHARSSSASQFIVATEKGMVYRLRKELPEKEFLPVSMEALCDYMKACTFEKLLDSLERDRLEVVLCDDCCDPKEPYQDDMVVHIQRSVARQAEVAIRRMFEVI